MRVSSMSEYSEVKSSTNLSDLIIVSPPRQVSHTGLPPVADDCLVSPVALDTGEWAPLTVSRKIRSKTRLSVNLSRRHARALMSDTLRFTNQRLTYFDRTASKQSWRTNQYRLLLHGEQEFPFPKVGNDFFLPISRAQMLGMQFFIHVPFPGMGY